MAKAKKLKVGVGNHLPESIIQHIQSFLDGRQAAQTCILSKSWYNAWLTRPNLDLSESDFQSLSAFREFSRKSIQRYEELNLTIESLKLDLNTINFNCVSFSKDLLAKADRMGIKEICVLASLEYLTFPYVVLESKTLVRLSLRGCLLSKPPAGMENFLGLKSLTLEGMKIFNYYFSLIFPCLEDLTLTSCLFNELLNISSRSLKYISLKAANKMRAKFDVPSLRKFKFTEHVHITPFPMVSFATIPGEMESEILLTVSVYSPLGDSWFHHLRRFVKKLTGSKISISVTGNMYSVDGNGPKGRLGPVVENLRLSLESLSVDNSRFFAGVFWSCPPKYITLSWFPSSCAEGVEKTSNKLILFFCKEVEKGLERCHNRNQTVFGNLNLGEVSVECFNSALQEWRSLPLKTLLNASKRPRSEQQIRFQLKWNGK